MLVMACCPIRWRPLPSGVAKRLVAARISFARVGRADPLLFLFSSLWQFILHRFPSTVFFSSGQFYFFNSILRSSISQNNSILWLTCGARAFALAFHFRFISGHGVIARANCISFCTYFGIALLRLINF